MNEEALKISMRKFLKRVGVTSQQEIERAVQEADAAGRLEAGALAANVILTIPAIDLHHEINGDLKIEDEEAQQRRHQSSSVAAARRGSRGCQSSATGSTHTASSVAAGPFVSRRSCVRVPSCAPCRRRLPASVVRPWGLVSATIRSWRKWESGCVAV